MVAALQSAEAMKLAVGDEASLNRDLLALEVWRLEFDQIPMREPRPDCPTCGRREFSFLEQRAPSQTTTLCGRDAVQISIFPPARLSLATMAERLRALGSVTVNAYLLRFDIGAYEITLFPDGRAIIKGTDDPAEARTIYARYIGM
jgi:adenylyltransferase/sulfurtransferase